LMKLPPEPKWELPKRSALIELFKLVDFHPLSIKLVAYQCKERKPIELARSLEQLLAAEPQGDKQRCLIASLNLSLQRLDGDLLELLPRLGVFQGGALEAAILAITEFLPQQWQRLRLALERTGLAQIEMLENIVSPFLQFHPTLTPVLWGQLSTKEQANLRLVHQQHYYDVVIFLLDADSENPNGVRLLARRELSNLLWAVNGALDDRSENAVDFVDRVNKFLYFFGMERDRSFLTKRLSQLFSLVGSDNWYLIRSNQGDLLFQNGRYSNAAQVFEEILQGLSLEPSFDRISTLIYMGRCFRFQGQLTAAIQYLQEGLNLSYQLDQSQEIKRQRGTLQTELGEIFATLGEFQQAQTLYEDSQIIKEELGDLREIAVLKFQMGTLAMIQEQLSIAEQLCQEALKIFQQLKELVPEATAWHQLGIIYEKEQQWADADYAYRESVRIMEQQGNVIGAARTYGQLAILNNRMDNITDAEAWYRKALRAYESVGDKCGESRQLNNLANLLASQPKCLQEAQQLASSALEIDLTLDPAVASIWNTYSILAKIATAQAEILGGESLEEHRAKEYRKLARYHKAAYAGTQYELEQHDSFIELVITSVWNEATRDLLEPLLPPMIENGGEKFVNAIRRVLAGEREIEVLWDDLDVDDSMIIAAILGRVSEL
jgi:tetratricopeptide (TPR) repeat protein